MKAVQIVNPSEMKVVELEKPVVGAGEVLVRIKYVGFCGSDLNTFLGRNPMVKLPVVPGHEVGAVIEEIGPDVPAGFEKGMNVTLNPYTNCGKCASCRNGRVNACEHNETLGVQRNGVMCEYAVLPWTKIIPAGDISPFLTHLTPILFNNRFRFLIHFKSIHILIQRNERRNLCSGIFCCRRCICGFRFTYRETNAQVGCTSAFCHKDFLSHQIKNFKKPIDCGWSINHFFCNGSTGNIRNRNQMR